MPDAAAFPISRWLRGSDMIRQDLQAAGIDYRDDNERVVDFHALRHTFITQLAQWGRASQGGPEVGKALDNHADDGPLHPYAAGIGTGGHRHTAGTVDNEQFHWGGVLRGHPGTSNPTEAYTEIRERPSPGLRCSGHIRPTRYMRGLGRYVTGPR